MRPFLHFSVHPRYLVCLVAILALSAAAMRFSGGGVNFLPPAQRTNGEETLAAFSPVTQRGQASVVEIVEGDKLVALGTVVSPLGYVVTKASEIPADPTVKLADGGRVKGRLLATDSELDLALLAVGMRNLPPVRWGASSSLRKGDWVVSPGQEGRSWVGVVSANRRSIKRVGGALGVSLGEGLPRRPGVAILGVVADSPADRAGLEAGDQVLMVDGQEVVASQQLISLIQEHDPGDEVTLRVRRGRNQMSVRVELGFYSIFDPMNRNQQMSGETSDRRNGFPEVIQHVIPLTPDSMGSPLLNLRGETVGINIARADRVTSYALPAERVIMSVRALVEKAILQQRSKFPQSE